jgi:hypothetical protein
MPKFIAYIFTSILTVCVLFPIVLRSSKISITVTGLLALGILWAIVLLKAMPIGLKVPMLIVFSILTLISAAGIGSVLGNWFDRPRNEAPVIMGKGFPSGSIAIVYHPGGSAFPRKVILSLADTLAVRGYSVAIFTANPQLSIDQKQYAAVILGSPVYGGEIRPPLLGFASANSPLKIPVFGVLTGGFRTGKENDLEGYSWYAGRAYTVST